LYDHHAIDCGDGTVIEYSRIQGVRRLDMDEFRKGNPLFVKNYRDSYAPDVVVQRAESRLGEKQYNILTNNCEHFVAWCKTGQNNSEQIRDFTALLGSGFVGGVAGVMGGAVLGGVTGLSLIGAYGLSDMIQRGLNTGNPKTALKLFEEAYSHTVVAKKKLNTEYEESLEQVDTWQERAVLALKNNEEDLARSALEHKRDASVRANRLRNQIQQLQLIGQALKQKIATLRYSYRNRRMKR
jgi:5'-3' exonuclease